MTAIPAQSSTKRIHPRRHVRVAAIQIIFALDMSESPDQLDPEEIARMAEAKAETQELVLAYVQNVLAHQSQIDEKIEQTATMWPMDQMALVDKAIMRLAVYELLFETDTPPKVVINEAVELAKIYASDSAPRFINGVLGTIYEHNLSEGDEAVQS
jgi:N utilization substance protein B